MSTMLIANNCTRENGQFMGDQLCYLKVAYLFARNAPAGTDRIVMSMSPQNEMAFLWERFLRDPCGDGSMPPVHVVYDALDAGDNPGRWAMWDNWRANRCVDSEPFQHYRELYLRIHGGVRQTALCGAERGFGRANIYEYLWYGQEDAPESPPLDVDPWDNHGVHTAYTYGDGLIDHPPRTAVRDVYISPHAKTQGNYVFTFDFWAEVVHRLVDAGVTVTVGYDNPYFCGDLVNHPLYTTHWSTHRLWMEQVCRHKLVACGNTGTGWLAAACGVPMVTMEPPGSQMPDHRYRECGLRNIVEVVDAPDAEYVARLIEEEVHRRVVMTTGCYDILHAGHVRHLERARALGTRLVVALNSDASVRRLKGKIDGVERPVNPEGQRRAVLEALRCVDEVRLFDGSDARDLIAEVRPDVLACGHGYTPETVVGRDLVEGWGGCVVVTCSGDARDEPSTTKILRRAQRSEVVEVCRQACGHSCNPFEKLRLLADYLLSVHGVPGPIADVGAGRGGTSYVMRRLAPARHLYVFDTWSGNPHDDPLCHHRPGEWATPLEDCVRLVGEDGLTHYMPGVFPASADTHPTSSGPALEAAEFAFAYVDADTYQSTRDALEWFWPRMAAGGKVVVDDYGWEPCAGVKKAVDELFAAEQRREIQGLFTCVLEK